MSFKGNNKLDALEVKHRAERLSRDYNLQLTTEYFATIHNRSIPRIYDAFSGRAKSLLAKINRHLDVIEEREKAKAAKSCK